MNEVHVFPPPQKNSLHKPIDLWGRLPNRPASSPRLRTRHLPPPRPLTTDNPTV